MTTDYHSFRDTEPRDEVGIEFGGAMYFPSGSVKFHEVRKTIDNPLSATEPLTVSFVITAVCECGIGFELAEGPDESYLREWLLYDGGGSGFEAIASLNKPPCGHWQSIRMKEVN